MGTAMRFVLGLAGLLSVVIGLGLLGPGIHGVIVAREEFDFPGGVPGIVTLILVAAAVPLLLGGYLLRKAFRSDAAALVPPADSTSPAPGPVAPPGARFEPQSTFSASPASIATPARAAPEAAAVLTTPEKGPRRRIWLAVLGLCVTLPGLLMLLVALAEIATGRAAERVERLGDNRIDPAGRRHPDGSRPSHRARGRSGTRTAIRQGSLECGDDTARPSEPEEGAPKLGRKRDRNRGRRRAR